MSAAGAADVVRFCYCGHAERRHEEEDGEHIGPCTASACGCAGMRHNPDSNEPRPPIRSITPPMTLPPHVLTAPIPIAVARPPGPVDELPAMGVSMGTGILHRAEHSSSAATRRMGRQIEAALGKLGLRLESEAQNLAARTELAACEQRAAELRESLHSGPRVPCLLCPDLPPFRGNAALASHRRSAHPEPPS